MGGGAGDQGMGAGGAGDQGMGAGGLSKKEQIKSQKKNEAFSPSSTLSSPLSLIIAYHYHYLLMINRTGITVYEDLKE